MNATDHNIEDGVEYKRCSSCLNLKTLECYGVDNARKDKLNPYCKQCKNTKSKIYKEENIEDIRRRGRERYYNNHEKLLRQSNLYHYRKTCELYGGEEEYTKIKKKVKINEKITFNILSYMFPNVEIENNSYKIYTEELSIRNFIVPDFFFTVNNRSIIVEYNGEQHYGICPRFFGKNAELRYQEQMSRDNYLREYCKANGIILIEIDGRYIRGFSSIKSFLADSFTSNSII